MNCCEFQLIFNKHHLKFVEPLHIKSNHVYSGKICKCQQNIKSQCKCDPVIIKFFEEPTDEIKYVNKINELGIDINIPDIIHYDSTPIIIKNVDHKSTNNNYNFFGGYYIQKYIDGFVLSHIPDKYLIRAYILSSDALNKLHLSGFIHGDVHGENMIYSCLEDKIYLIDFECIYYFLNQPEEWPILYDSRGIIWLFTEHLVKISSPYLQNSDILVKLKNMTKLTDFTILLKTLAECGF